MVILVSELQNNFTNRFSVCFPLSKGGETTTETVTMEKHSFHESFQFVSSGSAYLSHFAYFVSEIVSDAFPLRLIVFDWKQIGNSTTFKNSLKNFISLIFASSIINDLRRIAPVP